MEPLFIGSSRPAYASLIGQAHELSEASARLDALLSPKTAQSLCELVAGMNCYYSNLIEGHRTLPIEIAQALLDHEKKDLRSLALAHIKADRWAQTQSLDTQSLLPFITETHARFCEHLPTEMLKLKDGSLMTPGTFRDQEIQVGRHIAPEAKALPLFLETFASIYGRYLEKTKAGGVSKLEGILAAFFAHHRFVWIHPFPDGNGRVARILMDCMLRQCSVNRARLWSISRGFAKSADEYKSALAEADQSRMGDLDGRGNLSEKKLASFCSYAISIALDQVKFMNQMFSLENFKFRADQYFQQVRFDLRPESRHLFLHAFSAGEFERMEAGRITGLGERTARNTLNQLVKEGLLRSDTPKGRVRVGFPVHALGSLLPNLYPPGDLISI